MKNVTDENIMENDGDKIVCIDCSVEIIEYYNEKYKGKRGKCLKCKMDFPLE